MSYIEKDFPIERLNAIALKEANAKKPIYQIHKWWARRLGSIFRMIILATFLPQDISEDELWQRFYRKTDLGGKIVLDPFMGGGTTVVEALKLGCRVIGIDIHPVAWFITKKEVEPLDIDKFKEAFKRLEERVAHKIKRYYKTICPKCFREADVMYVFWVKKVKCLRCGADVPLFNSFKLASIGKNLHVVFCPDCRGVFEVSDVNEEVMCPYCEKTFTPSKGYAKGKHYLCPNCGHKGVILKAVRKEGKVPSTEMFAIEYHCPSCQERGYKKADDYDLELYLEAKNELERKRNRLLFPRQRIPDGYNTRQAKNFFYKFFYQMFNERQLLCLCMLLEEILRIEDENIREFMIITFSDCVNSNNMFCIYNIYARKIEPLFGLHAYYPKNMPVENNIWGTKLGRGTFVKYVKKTIRAKRYNIEPYEIKVTQEGKTKKIKVAEKVFALLVDNFDELLNKRGNAMLLAQTAEDLSFIPDGVVDAVITDPPYYDNVMYSEIADFFYVWQRLALKEKYECYCGEYSPRAREIIKNDAQGKDDSFFLRGLTRVFKECNRVLKDDGVLAFTFHHERSKAWASTLRAILEAHQEQGPRFVITAIYPIRSEGRTGVHAGGIRYDIIMVCKKTFEEPERISWEALKDRIHDKAKETLERLWLSGRELSDSDMFVIAMGKCLELYSKHYPNVFKDGKRVEIEEAVSDIDDIIDSLLKIKDIEKLILTEVDEITRLYCSYLVGPYDTLSYDDLHKRLSKGGIDIDMFIKERLIEKVKNKVRVLGPEERRPYIETKLKKGLPLLSIDKVHILYCLYSEGKPLRRYVEMYGDEAVKRVAKLIYRKTGEEVYAKIAGIVTTTPKTKLKPKTLEEFFSESP